MGDDAFSSGHYEFPKEYGYVVWAAALTFILNFIQTVVIDRMRGKYNVQYPTMISDDPAHNTYNCAQRVHQNTLEQTPFFLVNLAFGGLRHAKSAAAFGLVYLVARVIYSIGYWTGVPSRRIPGSLLSVFGAQFPLFALAISTGAGFLDFW